ncbi:uncharacterized protein A4U43_C09F5520 [Asparagus officinalis]|uniref:Uncharacterized protein n=1 Tax=Asparagus officinalis TaxID=4686 RepID=A0A5P1E621_ASPOF|nr:forkhead box protein D1-like [Asparagus officinalis]ONK57909.1 uncharacterized protein A4U43_C09F5520 [Asparagus officinalis]
MDRVKAIQRDIQKLLEHVLELLQAIYMRPAGGGVPIKYSPPDIGIPNININQKGGGGGGGGGGGEEKGGGGNGGDGSKQMVNVYNLFSNGIDV